MSRQKLLELDEVKRRIEHELAELSEYLNAPGMPGISGSLIDAEGFPIQGVDHYQIRSARQRFNVLNNDYTKLMNSIETELHAYFANGGDASDEGAQKQGAAVEVSLPAQERLQPFALITEVTVNSPAFAAGIKVDDRVMRFGHVTARTPGNLQALAKLVRESEGQELRVHLLRKNALNEDVESTVTIVPHKWEGAGLLGCRFQPV